MASPTTSDKSGQESDSEEVSGCEMSDLANSLISSKEAMNVLGSALAGQVVGALRAQGLVPAQDQLAGGLPAMQPSGHPYHVMGRGFGAPIPAHAQMNQFGYGMAPFLPPPSQFTWPGYQGQSPNVGSPFDRLGPPNQPQPSSQVRRSHSGSSSSLTASIASETEREQGEEKEGGTISLHTD